MKTIFFLIFLFLNLFFPVSAQDNASDSAVTKDDAVEKIKKIAENAVDDESRNKVYVGYVFDIKDDELVLVGESGEKITVSLFITDFYQIGATKMTEIKKENIKKNDYIFVRGPQLGDTITANAVYKDTAYFFIAGKIATIDKANFSIDLVTFDKRQVAIDIETSTKQNMFNIKSKKSDKTGFSKLKEGDSVHVVVKGISDLIDEDRYTASRLYVVPNEFFLQ